MTPDGVLRTSADATAACGGRLSGVSEAAHSANKLAGSRQSNDRSADIQPR